MTTLAELRTMVANDIRDPLMSTFHDDQIDALINAGMNEVSRVYPKQILDDLPPVADQFAYDTLATQVFRVELYRDGHWRAAMPESEWSTSQDGWSYWAGQLHFPEGTINQLVPSTDFMRVWGYAPRPQLLTDDQVADLDTDGEWGVRFYARWQAYQAMLADRNLYKQWQAISQNTDISPTQLQQDVMLFSGEWDRHRNHLRRLRG